MYFFEKQVQKKKKKILTAVYIKTLIFWQYKFNNNSDKNTPLGGFIQTKKRDSEGYSAQTN